MTTIVLATEAEAQLRDIVDWWIANRTSAPNLVADEFARCVSLLEFSTDVRHDSAERCWEAFADS